MSESVWTDPPTPDDMDELSEKKLIEAINDLRREVRAIRDGVDKVRKALWIVVAIMAVPLLLVAVALFVLAQL